MLALLVLAAVVGLVAALRDRPAGGPSGAVWSAEHGHWHDAP